MKKIAIILCGLGLGLLNLSAQETKETVPPLSGWKYYGGDEFNGTAINRKLWGIYGDKTLMFMVTIRTKVWPKLIVIT